MLQLGKSTRPWLPISTFSWHERLFKTETEICATFLLYVGQLRYRAYLMANPRFDPSGEPALFASLMEMVGLPINKHAFGNVEEAVSIIDEALAWDAANPDTSIPIEIRERNRAALMSFREKMSQNADAIRKQREASGLENR